MNTLSERRIRNNRIRRRHELRRRLFTFIFAIILSAGISFSLFSFRTKAQSRNEEIQYKYYKSIMIKSGDTLWNFAEETGALEHYGSRQEYIDEIMRMNGLPDEQITTGQYIIIPYFSSEFVG